MMASSSPIPIFLCLVAATHAYTKFDSKCSVPSDSVNFVSSADTRGTLNILWSCLFTIFACTWTIQHLNVPEQRYGRDKSRWECIKWWLRGPLNSMKWMLITAFAPELILGKAWSDLSAARENQKKMQKWAKMDRVEWQLSHSFFANMGGFLAIPQDSVEVSTAVSFGGLTDGPLKAQEGQHEKQPEDTERSDIRKTTPLVLPGETILEMREKKYIKYLLDITHDELSDKSKGNVFAKAIAISQVSWNTIQIVTRAAKGLTITQLELAVTAFSCCTIITYLLLLKKPQGVQVPTRPVNCTQASEELILQKNKTNGRTYGDMINLRDVSRPRDHIPNDLIVVNAMREFSIGLTVGAVVFGAIHVAGWNLVFPSGIERFLWRIAAVHTVGYPLFQIVMGVTFGWGDEYITKSFLFRVLFLLMTIFYIPGRLFLIVEYFRTLFFLPPDAYISTWASNIPHVA